LPEVKPTVHKGLAHLLVVVVKILLQLLLVLLVVVVIIRHVSTPLMGLLLEVGVTLLVVLDL
jgi:hypothetical protein